MSGTMARAWYRLVVAQAQAEADLYIFGAIGQSFWDDNAVSARQFVADLAALPESVKTLRVHVNSPGGNFFDGVAIANTLRAQSNEKGRRVEVLIEGLAASAATLVTSAGDAIKIAENASMMIHNPVALTLAGAKEHRKTADLLDSLADSIVATYRWHSKLEPEALKALMDEETWMGAAEAVANGLATEVIQAVPVEACLDPRSLALLGRVPERFRASVEALIAKPEASAPGPTAPAAAKPEQVLALVEGAGLSTGFARELVEAALPLDEVHARIARAKEIRALCATAKQPELADGYIRSAMSAADVKAHLTIITAKLDRAEIDTGLKPDADAPPKARIDTAAIYAERNRPLVPATKGAASC